MKEKNIKAVCYKIITGWVLAGTLALAGCASRSNTEEQAVIEGIAEKEVEAGESGDFLQEETDMEDGDAVLVRDENTGSASTGEEKEDGKGLPEPQIIEKDWSEYFGGLNGAAVVYDAIHGQYMIYNEELERISYGNRDISDWEGRLNTNNNNRALTGFWIESSLKISPLEQMAGMCPALRPGRSRFGLFQRSMPGAGTEKNNL